MPTKEITQIQRLWNILFTGTSSVYRFSVTCSSALIAVSEKHVGFSLV